jgi:hypothetical protein
VIPPLSKEEFAAVLALPAPRRYDYFVKKVADRDSMWCLRDQDGWVTTVDDDGGPYLPLWPHPDFAAACATDEWERTAAAAIDVDEWIESGAAGLEEEGLAVAVFPTPAGSGIPVPPARLKADLENEQSKFLL